MKRALAFTLMVLAIMIIAVSCEEPHVHTYSEEWSNDETNHWHEATCEDTDEVRDKAKHTWEDWITDKEATETEKGSKHRICSVCKYKATETIPVLGHVHTPSSTYVSDEDEHWQICSGCENEINRAEHTIECVSVDDINHEYRCSVCEKVTKTEAHDIAETTYLTTGKKEQSCTKCSYKKTLADSVTEKAPVTTKTSNSGTEVNSDKVVVKASISANETTSSPDEKTIVTFPAESLTMTTDAREISLTVKAIAVTEVSSDDDYKITTTSTAGASDAAVVAGFEFTLKGADSSDFGPEGVKVTTYISPGLTTENITSYKEANSLKIQYVGTETNTRKPQITYYRTSDGYLEYTVYHFSRYAIFSEDVIAMDNKGNMYTSLEDRTVGEVNVKGAISGVLENGTITLLKNIDLTPATGTATTVETAKNLTINLNGKTIKSNARIFRVRKGTLTVENGAIEANIEESSKGSSAIIISCEEGDANVVLKSDATVKAPGSYGITSLSDQSTTDKYATIDIYGTIESANPCVAGNGNNGNYDHIKVTINVYQGAVLTQDSSKKNWDTSTSDNDPVAIYQPNDGKLNIYGGTITSVNGTAVEIRRGTAEIKGGTIKSEITNFEEDFKEGKKDGPTTKGAAVAVNYYGDAIDTENSGITVTITGGNFVGAKKLALIRVRNIAYGDIDVKATVSGVSFEDNDVYGLKVDENTYYPTLEMAVKAAKNDSKITLLNDVDLTYYEKGEGYTFTFAKNVTLEMNKKTITSYNFGVVYEGDGLKIQNGSFVAKDNGSYALFIGNGSCDEGTEEDYDICGGNDYYKLWTATVENVKCTGGINVYVHRLIITDGDIEGSISEASGTQYYALWADAHGEIIVRGGEYTSKSEKANCVLATCVTENTKGKIIIEDGNFTATGDVKVFSGTNNNFVVTGGTFSENPKNYVDEEKYKVENDASAGTWTVAKKVE